MALTDEPRSAVKNPGQPTAPYLDAVWGYAFRGSTRFHVPGHKGGATMVLILGLGQPPADLERFAHDFSTVVDRIGRPGEATALVRAASALENEVVVPPREAFLGEAEPVGVDDAIGRVSAESIAGYPPGIPALLPGERITTELVAYLRELKDSGARLHGASDPQFRTIFVLTSR